MGNKNSAKTESNELTEEQIETLMSETGLDRDEILKWYNEFKQDYPEGKLSKKDFAKTISKLLKTDAIKKGKPQKYSNFVFKAFDADKSNYIDYSEFILAVCVFFESDIKKRLEYVFKISDTDKDEKVDLKELTNIIKAIYELKAVKVSKENSAESKAKLIMKVLDIDHDSYLSKDEFVDGFYNFPEFLPFILVE